MKNVSVQEYVRSFKKVGLVLTQNVLKTVQNQVLWNSLN